MLKMKDAALMVIDIQGKLAEMMHERDRLFENASKMIRGAQALELPIVWTEQYPKGLGPTSAEIAELLEGETALPKTSFSCCGDEGIVKAVEATGRRQILLVGIEAHICIYQTALGLIEAGYEVVIVTDAVSSRKAWNRELGLARMKDAGCVMTSGEMSLFEMLGVAEGDRFKAVIRIVK